MTSNNTSVVLERNVKDFTAALRLLAEKRNDLHHMCIVEYYEPTADWNAIGRGSRGTSVYAYQFILKDEPDSDNWSNIAVWIPDMDSLQIFNTPRLYPKAAVVDYQNVIEKAAPGLLG